MGTTSSSYVAQNSAVLLEGSRFVNISPKPIIFVAELLSLVQTHRPEQPVAMLRTTARHIADCLVVPLVSLHIDALQYLDAGFKKHLQMTGLRRNSVRSYVNLAKLLLRLAQEFGWQSNNKELQEEWARVLDVAVLAPGCRGIVQYAIARGIPPRELSEKHLAAWVQAKITQGRGDLYIKQRVWFFRHNLADAGLLNCFPLLTPPSEAFVYGIPVEKMPEPLRDQVKALLSSRLEYDPERTGAKPLRPVSVAVLEGCITRLYGFAINIRKLNPANLLELVDRKVIAAFFRWAVNERKFKGVSLVNFGQLCAALKDHSDYKDHNFQWLSDMVNNVPREHEDEARARKAQKCLSYSELQKIPPLLREARERGLHLTRRQRALLFHDELLIEWMLFFPWRQRNLREARLGEPEDANVFKDGFNSGIPVAQPAWVTESLQKNPSEMFWQIHFRPCETKTGQSVRAVVPRRLVFLLEEYLQYHRPILLRDGYDPGTLFVNRVGRRFMSKEVLALVGNLTARYGGRRMTPHLFRDSFAYAWLDAHSADYLTLSKILWHRNIKTTIRIYGREFDESNGAQKTEEWLEGSHDCGLALK
jgi:integrase